LVCALSGVIGAAEVALRWRAVSSASMAP
jgi:hypothetical protein